MTSDNKKGIKGGERIGTLAERCCMGLVFVFFSSFNMHLIQVNETLTTFDGRCGRVQGSTAMRSEGVQQMLAKTS